MIQGLVKSVLFSKPAQAFFGACGTRLFEGAYPTDQQRARPSTPCDLRKTLTQDVWRNLLGYARHLYANYGPIKAAVQDKATLSVIDGWIPQYHGKDKAWGDVAEQWLLDWFKVCDVRGPNFNFWQDLWIASIAMDRDGDFGIIAVDNGSGYPQIQFITADRIGSRPYNKVVEDGPYKGLRIDNGVIFNEFWRPVAYRVLTGEYCETFEDVSARDMGVFFDPDWHDMGRGISSFSHAILDAQDVQDIFGFLKAQIKSDAVLSFEEQKLDGQIDPAQSHFRKKSVGAVDDRGNPIETRNVTVEVVDGIEVRRYRAGTGEGLKAIESARPSPNVLAATKEVLRGVFSGMGSAIEVYDSSDIGGAGVRVLVDKVNKAVKKRQGVLKRVANFITFYGLAKAAKLKLIPPMPDDFYRMDFTLPGELTPDAGKEAEMDREGIRLGTSTYREHYGKRGMDEEEQLRQKAKEAKLIKDLAAEFGVEESAIRMLAPNDGVQNQQQDNTPQNDQQKGKKK